MFCDYGVAALKYTISTYMTKPDHSMAIFNVYVYFTDRNMATRDRDSIREASGLTIDLHIPKRRRKKKKKDR